MAESEQDQVSFMAGAVLAGIVLFISYKLIYEWRANRALAREESPFCPSFAEDSHAHVWCAHLLSALLYGTAAGP